MKKAIKTLYKISFVLDLVSMVAWLVLFIVSLNLGDKTLLGFSASVLTPVSIISFIVAALCALVYSAAAGACETKPSWKRPHILSICLAIFNFDPLPLIAGILALIEFSKQDVYGQNTIDPKQPLTTLHLNKREKFILKFTQFFLAIPRFIAKIFIAIGKFFKKLGLGIYHFFKNIVMMFAKGSWKTKVSFLIMGFGNLSRKQFLRGLLFLALELIFVVYMVLVGGKFLSQLGTLGTVAQIKEQVPIYIGGVQVDTETKTVYVDNSFKILLYGVLTIFFIIGLLYTWYLNIKQAYANDKIDAAKEKLKTDKDDLHALVDQDFYKTLLALPLVGILIFTVMPLVFMILVAFTNYDKDNFPPNSLFNWVGFDNFAQLFTWNNGGVASFSATFGEILLWTLIWAFFATFTNYFLGMMVAMLINKKGIKLKKLWRTVLVFSIAIPQFISLLYVSKMFDTNGTINAFLQQNWHFKLPFWTDPTWARITVIVINIWIGIPYLMLITTGILMNIPADLYESSKIDGASPIQQYMKITLPYMLFVTGPYLLTSFTGNMNNFNVIYLLTGGGPKTSQLYGVAGRTDLLITWLFSLTVTDNNYKFASVIGIMVFIVVSVLSLVVYNLIPSTKNEEDFA